MSSVTLDIDACNEKFYEFEIRLSLKNAFKRFVEKELEKSNGELNTLYLDMYIADLSTVLYQNEVYFVRHRFYSFFGHVYSITKYNKSV